MKIRSRRARMAGVGLALVLGAALLSACQVPSPFNVRIAAGGSNTCTLKADRTVECWGANGSRQLGALNGDIISGNTVPGLSGIVQLTLGQQHACAVVSGGGARCWGTNSYGEDGDGTTDWHGGSIGTVVGISDATGIDAGGHHTCAALSSGGVRCWGRNNLGQLGNASTTNSAVPVDVGLSGVTQVSAGADHTCARLGNGTVSCWGANDHGQLGNASTSPSTTPVTVSGLASAEQISAGDAHTCAIVDGAEAKCWGGNATGALGDQTFTDRGEATTVLQGARLTDVDAVSTGNSHTCVLRSPGDEPNSVWCFGFNSSGQLGDGTTTKSPLPVQAVGVHGVASLATGQATTCAVMANGTVTCWGLRQDVQPRVSTTTPVTIGGLSSVAQVDIGFDFACALRTDGTVRCWGANLYGQLGDGSNTTSTTPVTVAGLSDVVQISTGSNYSTCAVRSDGTVWCWGRNVKPTGRWGEDSSTPVQVAGISGATSVSSDSYSCASLTDGTVTCWGPYSYGLVPVRATGVTGAVQVAAGYDRACALRQDDTVTCWVPSVGSTPTTPLHLGPVVATDTGKSTSCAVLPTGEAKCWGFGSDGQNGNGSLSGSKNASRYVVTSV